MSLADVDADRVYRCGFRLEQVAEEVRTAAARTAGAYPSDWRGDAGIAYQQRIDATADRVRRMADAYAAAGAALVPYARAVAEAQDLARRAEALLGEAAAVERRDAAAAAAQGVPRLVGPSPAEGLRAAAARVAAEAAEVERRAAAVCAAALSDEASRAPRVSAWRNADRFLGDLAQVGVDTVAGTASLLGSAWHAMPGVGSRHSRSEARHDLAESAWAAASVWKIPAEIRDELQDGRSGLAAGEVLGIIGPGKLAKLDRRALHARDFATLDALDEHGRKARVAEHVVWRQTAAEMGRNGVDLVNEEARGGHVWDRHVGKPDAYLFGRLGRKIRRAGTFTDLGTAERLVNAVLRHHAQRLNELYTMAPGEPLRLDLRFEEPVGRVAVKGSDGTVAAYAVTVILRLEGDEPHVVTAFPEL